jgi:hypothetical protein
MTVHLTEQAKSALTGVPLLRYKFGVKSEDGAAV